MQVPSTISASTCSIVSSGSTPSARTVRRSRRRRRRRARSTWSACRACGSPRAPRPGRSGRRPRDRRPRARGRARRRASRAASSSTPRLVRSSSSRLGRLVEHGEARRDIGLERKLLQQPRAEGVDGLHLQPARRLERGREQPPRPRAHRRVGPDVRDRRGSPRRAPSSSSAVHGAARSNTRFAMLAAAALVKVMQRMRAGSTPSSSSRITRCASTWVLPEPALAATQAETAGIGRLDLHARADRSG